MGSKAGKTYPEAAFMVVTSVNGAAEKPRIVSIFNPLNQHVNCLSVEKLFCNKFIEIWYDPENRWLYSKWQDYQTMESIQTGGEELVRHLKEKACSKILNDNLLVKGTWTFAADWTTNVWFPQIVQAGLKQFAWVYSPDVFSRFSSEKAIKNNPGQIVRYFNSIEEGKSG